VPDLLGSVWPWCISVANSLLAIDPGLQGTGLAFWYDQQCLAPDWVRVVRNHGVKNKDWVVRAHRLVEEVLSTLSEEVRVNSVACELMEMHGSARAQMMWKAGDFQRTLVFIGMLVGRLRHEMLTQEFKLVKPSEWKGQMPKSVAERRIRKKLGDKVCRRLKIQSHAWDAVGIGLWAKGVF